MSVKSSTSPAAPRRRTWRYYLWRILRGVIIAVVLIALLVVGGGVYMMEMPGSSWQGPLPDLTPHQQKIQERLRQDVETLCNFGIRGTHHGQGLDQAADWIESQVTALGYRVTRQTYPADGHDCANLIAEKIGDTKPDEVVVIGAHYDSMPVTVGADDNASGVAALLAIARKMAHAPCARTLRLVFFVNEEPPYFHTPLMGSQVYAQACRQHSDNIVAVVAFDGLGYYSDAPDSQHYPPPFSWFYPATADFIGFAGNLSSRAILRQSIGVFRRGVSFPSQGIAAPQATPGLDLSDHSSFWQAGYPAILVSDTLPYRYRYYHTPGDKPDQIDYARLARVVDGLGAVTQSLAQDKTTASANP